ncbi:MAG: hypothetical protein ACRBG0_02275 [Lewinella sp.]|jgi:hypothetical protein|uniref:hypothetical protein n=1 Tax=Lewinella sp. TaxID=2004506 RepID=UPI003D6B1DC2
MTRLRLFVLTIFCCSLAFSSLQAQDYQKAIGLRLGYPVSISYKMFLGNSNNALEAFVNYRSQKVFSYGWTRIGVGGAYQVHNPISSVDGLQWYYGGGAAIYFWSYDNDFSGFEDEANLSLGIQGYLGLDYKFAGAPVNLSLDWVPTFYISGYGDGFGADNGALTIRYTFEE